MHKLLLTFTALGGLALAVSAPAQAAPVIPHLQVAPAAVQTVQYYPEYYHRHDWRGHRWHRWHHWHHGY